MTSVPPCRSSNRSPGYGRARLWVGISAVGTLVTLAAAALAAGLPTWVDARVGPGFGAALMPLAMYVAAHAAVQLPFDFFGGYFLPMWYGRSRLGIRTFLGRFFRGAVVYGILLFTSLSSLLVGGHVGGVWGVIAAGSIFSCLLLWCRLAFAKTLAHLCVDDPGGSSTVVFVSSDDEGFTGGVLGVLTPRRFMLPVLWQSSLTADQFAYARRRREIAGSSGIWRRGRVVAIVFTLAGMGLSAVAVGPDRVGTAGGTIEFGLWFTLWSFFGLLTLPTLSRRGVAELDAYVRSASVPDTLVAATARTLDAHQDDEPIRPALVEAIFHPIPSIQNREGVANRRVLGAWDAARTAVYLGLSGGGLLGRAVHCNCGRPALWAFLPVD